MAKMTYDHVYFDKLLMYTRMYFKDAYHGGTREMIHRYVCKKMGYVPPKMLSAALKILRNDGGIMFECKVWWDVGLR